MSAKTKTGSKILAAIFGCSGQELTETERSFFQDANPLGFILFSRNIASPGQVRSLVSELRSCLGRLAPVLIDQEGGRVQRLQPPHWRSAPPLNQFGLLYREERDRATRALRMNMQLIGAELLDLGIDINCSPVLDVPVVGAHSIIGDRALSEDPLIVSELGIVGCEGLIDAGVVPVIKHLPGHGRALVDSHEELPRVETGELELISTDLSPFREVGDLPVAGMTAHVVYDAFDPVQPATMSTAVIAEVIRGYIGFSGLLLSDDLSMKALSGTFSARARNCLNAGCDVALHCGGDLEEMREVAEGSSFLSDTARASVARLDLYRGKPRVQIEKERIAREVTTLLELASYGI